MLRQTCERQFQLISRVLSYERIGEADSGRGGRNGGVVLALPARKMSCRSGVMIREHCSPGPHGLNGLIAGIVGVSQTFDQLYGGQQLAGTTTDTDCASRRSRNSRSRCQLRRSWLSRQRCAWAPAYLTSFFSLRGATEWLPAEGYIARLVLGWIG